MPEVGELAPDFALPDDSGATRRLSDFRGKKIILYFYPEDFTSGCELQACRFRDAYDQIQYHNAVVLGISPDSVDSHRRFREAHDLPFHLLVDSDMAVAREWGNVKTAPGADGTASESIQRGQYIIDENGMVIGVQSPIRAAESLKLALEELGIDTNP